MTLAAPRLDIGTHVSGHIITDTYWNAAGSPYLLDGEVDVDAGAVLDIGPGVTVMLSSTTSRAPLMVSGILNIHGLSDKRVSIAGLEKIHAMDAQISMAHADMSGGSNLILYKSRASIASSTFTRTNGASIYAWGSSVDMSGSRIEESLASGIYALDASPMPSAVNVHNSVIGRNALRDIDNSGSIQIKAENNWWGDAGPVPERFRGPVSYAPWLAADPIPASSPAICCSSVLFLPGLEASRLYRPEALASGFGTASNRLWEPNRNADVQKLFLNADGSSADQTIYSGEPIGKAFGIVGIYGSFMAFLDDLSAKGIIREWKPFGYDWRRPVDQVASGIERKATTTERLIDAVRELAGRSSTGKVTIIAHSNGGLVAKSLVKALADIGKESLIDTVISVAVPYLGTPQAIAGLLHGDDQSMGGGLLLKGGIARKLGRNMASAYSLLPSKEFFSKILGPTIAFASTTVPGVNNDSYPVQIVTAAGQSSFIADSAGIRQEPASTDLRSPIKGSQILLAASEAVHSILDPFAWPASIARWAIVGWNSDTVRSILYSSAGYATSKTKMGDGTVIAPSAAYQAGTTTAIDLAAASAYEHKSFEHKNILESILAQSAIRKIITKDSRRYCDDISRMPGAVCGEPEYAREPSSLVLSTHSPVELHIYDEAGRHTGISPLPATDEPIEDGLFSYTERSIPGSNMELRETPNGDKETYAYLPDNGQKYRIEIIGIGVGTFTYDIERKRGSLSGLEKPLGSAEYAAIPITPFSIATSSLQLAPVGLDATATPGFASLTGPLSIDANGDGVTDYVATSSAMNASSTAAYTFMTLENLKKTIVAIYGSASSDTKSLLRRIDKLESLIQGGNAKRLHDYSARLFSQLGHKSLSAVSDADKAQVMNLISLYISQFE